MTTQDSENTVTATPDPRVKQLYDAIIQMATMTKMNDGHVVEACVAVSAMLISAVDDPQDVGEAAIEAFRKCLEANVAQREAIKERAAGRMGH